MAKTRRAYTGGAVSTTTSSNIAASGTTSFTVAAATGWPYGSDPFFVVVEPGTASEEKILVTRAGSGDTTINIASDSQRGQDGTVAVSHSNGATVFPVFTALDADEANELASKWTSKGDLVSYGSSTFEKLGVGADDTVLIADSGEASGLKWGSVTAAQLATGANKLGSGSAVRTLGSFVGGDVLQAAELNAIGAVTSFTPSYTGGVTVGNATRNVGYYYVFNDLLYCEVSFTAGSTSSFASPLGMTLPNSLVRASDYANGDIVGSGGMSDAGVGTYTASVITTASSTTVALYINNSAGTNTALGSLSGFANTDYFNFSFVVRLA